MTIPSKPLILCLTLMLGWCGWVVSPGARGQAPGDSRGAGAPRSGTATPRATPKAVTDSESIADLALLKAAGVVVTGQGLLDFLNKGVSGGRIPDSTDGGQLAVEAMARLAELRFKPAVPTLSRITKGDLPDGLAAMLDKDLQSVTPRSRPEVRDKGLRILRINAATALGWIGDPRGLDAVVEAMNSEPSTAMRLQLALSMALLGDPRGMDFVTQVISKGTRREVAAAAAVYESVTGKDFGITEQTPVRQRRARASQYGKHWSSIRGQFRPDREAIYRRRQSMATKPTYKPTTTADYLKLAANYLDMNDGRGSRSAREYLAQAGGSLNPELQRIAGDPDEDLDVRMEAMNWLFQNQRQRAYPFLKSLRRDENPEIVDKANSLLTAPVDPLQTNYVFPKQ